MPKPILVTAGDVSFDWLWFEIPADEAKKRREQLEKRKEAVPKWLSRSQVVTVALHGGAWYLDNFVRMLLGPEDQDQVYSYRRFKPHQLRAGDYEHIIHADIGYKPRDFLPCCPPKAVATQSFKTVYRCWAGPTYFGPLGPNSPHPVLEGSPRTKRAARQKACDQEIRRLQEDLTTFVRKALDVPQIYPNDVPAVVLLHDENNGFSRSRKHWEALLPREDRGNGMRGVKAVILNLDAVANLLLPGAGGGSREHLWTHLADAGYLERTTVVVGGDDLRRAGVRISKGLSWERTAHDFLSQVDSDPILKELTRARHLVVRLANEGVLHYAKQGKECILYFYTDSLEGDFRNPERHGRMFGSNAILAATLAVRIRDAIGVISNRKTPEACAPAVASALQGDAVRCGLGGCRAYFRHGSGHEAVDLHRRLEEEWDQLSDGKHYPPDLTQMVVPAYTEPGMDPNHIFWIQLDVTPKRPWRSRFYPNKPQTERNFGGDVLYPESILHELAENFVGRLEESKAAKIKDAAWEVRRADVTVPGRVFLDVVFKSKDVRPDAKAWEDLALDFKKLLNDAERKKAEHEARKGAGKQPADVLRRRVRAYVDQWTTRIYREEARKIDWAFGWPVCVRGFLDDHAQIARKVVAHDPDWLIINPASGKLYEIAENIVLKGIPRAFGVKPDVTGEDERFPVMTLGKLVTVDRKEIESYRSIRNLMQEYMAKPRPDRPLSIAVFGPPGSGKSFGVKEIANSIDKEKYSPLEYNLSQFAARDDLVNAFIVARDKALEGKVPLIFFDEFDANLGTEPLGWLKYFLSVMQDGKYRFRDGELRIGQAILVFAGGTSHCYRDFAREATKDGDPRLLEFQRAKGPDFVSRLRGHVDIIGPNRRPDSEDHVYVIRRALALYAMLRKHHPRFVEGRDETAIDRNVLRALLRVYRYKHGVRSMEAILEMSTPGNAETFDKAALPPREQLAMHLEPNPSKPDELYELLEGR